jgi:hypothetical protein
VTCHCEELAITNRDNQLTAFNLQNKIHKTAAQRYSSRYAYEADFIAESNEQHDEKSVQQFKHSKIE